ncbi:tRNA threonylcarbamoyladenosine dehydratase [Clostridium sp. D2Q-14]|uniref:tRNA threonylcarbamoyladenosine dehydratase n=1 Tax=Anaeromonas gelatinilytica TaxID=2683194 RepID=UPI00193AF236|nr:tRNA threonylcarbamoyladenosine dehydratase [Anaeromonas gelatinilytica]MBS4536165.1 tRNA threonylcarbamoyladenosine dehydratase [Anaeromonas gelatinilytica]
MLHEFSRTEMVIGTENLNKLRNSTIAVFGIGGVGTFVVEGLVRSGVGKFILVDDDDICLTNINRQIHATRKTVGKSKVEVMKERIKEINSKVEVTTFQELYNSESAERLLSGEYDYVVDAIDMVSAKLDLIERCTIRNIPIMSSMGAGNKLNPTMLEVADIFDTSVCPLARIMRKELRNRGIDKLKVVYSKEKPIKSIELEGSCKTNCICPNKDRTCVEKRQIPGSTSFVPSVAGLIIASEVVKDIIK